MLAHVDLRAAAHRARSRTRYSAVLPFPIKGGKLYLYNNNPLLIYHYPGADRAEDRLHRSPPGRCLVATAERDGVRLGVVLLHSADPGHPGRAAARPRLRATSTTSRRVAEPPIPPGA